MVTSIVGNEGAAHKGKADKAGPNGRADKRMPVPPYERIRLQAHACLARRLGPAER